MRGWVSLVAIAMVAIVLALLSTRAANAQSDAEVDGATVFARTCSSCHGRSGQGIRGAFPPLADHLPDLLAAEGGRNYVISVALFGLQGEITVDGIPYNGVMPAQGHLSDAEIAAILHHIATELSEEAPTDLEPVTAEEVTAVRTEPHSPAEVRLMRPELTMAESEQVEPTLPPPFTVAQTERGNGVFQDLCVECHGANLQGGVVGGPPLRGGYFEQRWAGRSVAALFEYTRARMPQNRPGSLSDQQYADIVALILRTNGHSPGGGELPAASEALQRYVIGR